ncbi:MAG: hypothetical protein U0269_16565 [Polyangiales bacterium]
MKKTHSAIASVLAAVLASATDASAQVTVNTQLGATVQVAPPAAITEAQTPSPGPGYTWVAGFWSWNGSQYAWTAGHWEQPPASAQGWEPPQWERQGNGHRFRPGRWRGANNTTVAQPTQTTVNLQVPTPIAGTSAVAIATPVQVTQSAPPAAINEAQPPSPGAGYTWVAGFWQWNGTAYAWVAGRWEQTPQQAQGWEPPQWERDGTNYRYRPGRWRGRDNNAVVAQPSVQVVTVATPTNPVAIASDVATAPPAAINETQPPSPGANYVWVAGYWSWNGSQHVWTAGRWEQKPTNAQSWEPPQWERRGRGFHFRPGRWRGANNETVQQTQVVQAVPVAATVLAPASVVTVAPPASIAETQPTSPGAGYQWVPGFWAWSGTQYTWTAGHWEQPPVTNASWVAPAWNREGNSYRFAPGRWQTTTTTTTTTTVTQPPAGPIETSVRPPRPRAERRSRAPQRGMIWIAGNWTWNGSQYVWTEGRWEAPPSPRARWQAPEWRPGGQGWRYTPGRWR